MKQVNDVLDMFFAKVSGKLSGVPVFRHSYPDGYTADDFVVINVLSVPADSIQVVDVNVNCYEKSYPGSIPNLLAMGSTAADVIDELHGFHTFTTDRVHIGFQFMNIIREEGWHYANLRFQLIFLNN